MNDHDKIHAQIMAEEESEREPFWTKSKKTISALILSLLMVLFIIPHYAIKLDPSPEYIPSIEEVTHITEQDMREISHMEPKIVTTKQDFRQFVTPNDPFIKTMASKIVSGACDSSKICYAKALYLFVRDNFDYISDPPKEYIEMPKETIINGGADCDGGTVLLASLMESIGIDAELVFIPNHVYLRIYMPEASMRYRDGEWVYLDWTCRECSFGTIPFQNVDKDGTFVDV